MKLDTSKYKQDSNKEISKPDKTSIWQREISFSSSKLNDKLKERFYSDFLTLLKAGIDVQNALTILSTETSSKKYVSIIQQIEQDLTKGKTLSEAMSNSEEFTTYEINSIKIGEETGKLNMILEQLSKFYYGKIKLKRLMVKGMSYPVLILVSTIGVLVFMLNFVVPMFKDAFSQFDEELPQITLNILAASDWLKANFGYLFLVLLLIGIWFYLQRKKTWFRKFFSGVFIKIPFFGKLIKQIYLTRFYQFMFLLTNAKHNLVQSVTLVKDVIGFYPIEEALKKTEQDLKKGEFLHASLEKSDFFESRLITLVKVAENTNQLDAMFKKLSFQEQESLEIKTETIGTIIEPIMIILVGFLVVIILISMYLPLFNLGNLM